MVNSKNFAERLQEILDFYSITATAFAEEINFNRSSISHLLSGRNKPSLEFVMKVLQKFPEVELYWLLNGKGSFPSTSQTMGVEKNMLPEKKVELLQTTIPIKKAAVENEQTTNSSEIDHIVIFFKDGSFKFYKN